MKNIYIGDPQILNNTLQPSNFSYNNIFDTTNLKTMGNINNNIDYSINQNNPYLIRNNSSFFYADNVYNNINNINNNSNYLNNSYMTNNSNYSTNTNKYNNKIIINQIFTNTNQSSAKNLSNIYQNNSPNKMWMQNGNIYYSPTKLDNQKSSVYYNYSNLKYNNSYQNLTNRSNTSTLNLNNYNINSNNSTLTNTQSTTSIKKNNKEIYNPNPNPQNYISQINLTKNNSNIINNNVDTKKIQVTKKTIKKITVLNMDPKDRFDPTEFKIIKLIGEGSFGKIYEVQWTKNNKKYAMKKEPIKTNEIVNKRKEKIKLMNDFIKKTKTPGIIRIYGNAVKKEKDQNEFYYYTIIELAEKDWEKEINDRKKSNLYYTEKELFIIMSQLISTLSLLQKNHITHRDIKPQNILISNGLFKLSDFGEARTLKRSGVIISKARGTELFMSPVLFNGLKHKLTQVGHNTFKSDVFSLGLCFLFAGSLTMNSLYYIREINDTKKVKECLNKFLEERYSIKIIEILMDMLQIDENLRLDFISLEKKYFLKEK